jgi:peroxiredoxin
MYSKLNQHISTDNRLTVTSQGRNYGKEATAQLKVKDVISQLELLTIRGDLVQIPDHEKMVHLQFRRYAGCPVCNLHLRSFSRRHSEILAAGIREVVVFHSTAETMLEFQGQLPFSAIADPDKKLYAEFGADRKMSSRTALNPRMWWVACNALLHGLWINRLHGASGKGEEHSGLPADFLIGTDGLVLAAKYGALLDDHWSVDELLILARQA